MTNELIMLLDKLQDIYDRASIANSGRVFFLSTYEYVEVFSSTSLLKFIPKVIVQMGKEDNNQLERLAKYAFKEMQVVYAEITEYVERNNVKHKGVLRSLKDFEGYEKGIWIPQSPLRSREGKLSYALMLLVEDKERNHIPFCRKYGTISDEGVISEWHFSPSYNKWKEERNRMDRLQETTVWHSWSKLTNFHTIYKNCEELQDECLKNNKLFDVHGIKMLFDEIVYVMGDKKEPNRVVYEYLQPSYLLYLQRVHQFVKETLSTATYELEKKQDGQHRASKLDTGESSRTGSVTEKHDQKTLTCGKLHLDRDKGTLRFGDKTPIEISPDTNAIKLLIYLLNNQRVVEYEEIAKYLDLIGWHEGVTNRDIARDVQFIKRDLVLFLKGKVGMNEKDVQDLIISKKNVGYKLRCEANSLKTH